MDIAAMNKKVEFLRLTVDTDRYGNHRNIWEPEFTMSATVSGESGNEVNEAGVTVPKESFAVTVRYCRQTSQVTTDGYRIRLDGIQYDIRSIDHLNYKKHALKFICSKEGIGNAKSEDRGS